MFNGVIIKESLADTTVLDGLLVTNTKVVTIDNPAVGQSPVWTLVYFEVGEDMMDKLAGRLSRALAPGKWYIDIKSDTEVYVIFLDQVFRYKRGDAAGKQPAVDYALSIGVPESQLGWE